MDEARAIAGEVATSVLGVGMAFVTFVTRARDGTLRVCKRMRLAAVSDVARAQLAREAEALARIDGRGAPRLVASGEDEFGSWVSMELVSGRRPQSFDDARFAFEALASVHEAGIVHGDLSPSNVIVGTHRAWLVDFCTAHGRELPPQGAHAFTGTLAFAAPERARGEPSDERADLFSLAAAITSAATGRMPRAHGDLPQGAQLVLAGERRLDDAFVALAPPPLARCLAFDPAARPRSARAVLAEKC